ncbi:MAG: adenylate kinase [Bacteroidales bacterium]
MLNLVLFGPPGAGKGTQAEFVKNDETLIHLSTGDILRNEIANSTELGVEAKKWMDAGNLVPDAVVIGMIRNIIESNSDANGFIFDGFPRTVAQAEALDIMLESLNIPILGVVSLEVAEQELINRLLERGKVSGRADDQDKSVIANRISVYTRNTMPLLDYYKNQGKHIGVDGSGAIEEIASRVAESIDKIKSRYN